MTRLHHVPGAAVSKALRFFADAIDDGHIMACSLEWEPNRTARFTVVYAPGIDPVEVPGVAVEGDE